MTVLKKAEALKLGNRINKALRPFKQATEVLEAALMAEGETVALGQESEALMGIVKRLTKTVADLTATRATVEEELRVLAASITGEQEVLDAAKKTTTDELNALTAKEEQAQAAFVKVMDGLQGEADEADARLADLHTEEERVNAKIKQFEALANPQEV